MAKVIFWSPEKSMTGCTHTVIAVSTMMAIAHKASCLTINSYFDTNKIESAYTPYDELKASGALDNSNIGLGALIRLVISNKLTSDAIKNYAKPVLKERLDILYGLDSKDSDQYQQMVNNLQYIVKKANDVYDIIFVDLPKTLNEQYIKDTIKDSDLVVCVVNQDILKIDNFFDITQNNELLKNKNKIYVVGDYEEGSKYNLHNIRSKYKINDQIYALPHNYYFTDACNDGNVIDYFYRNINADNKDYNGKFLYNALNIAERIIEVAKIKDIL